MNEQDLKTVFNKLSAQAESLRRKQDITKQLEKIDYWIKTLTEKASEIVALGATPIVDITSRLSALEAEKKDLQSMLTPASAADIRALLAGATQAAAAAEPVQASTWKDPIEEDDAAEMNGLLHVMATMDLSAWEQEERWYQYEAWACRWRMVVGKYPKEIVDRSPLLKEVYGKIRDLMRASFWPPPLPGCRRLPFRKMCKTKTLFQVGDAIGSGQFMALKGVDLATRQYVEKKYKGQKIRILNDEYKD